MLLFEQLMFNQERWHAGVGAGWGGGGVGEGGSVLPYNLYM